MFQCYWVFLFKMYLALKNMEKCGGRFGLMQSHCLNVDLKVGIVYYLRDISELAKSTRLCSFPVSHECWQAPPTW